MLERLLAREALPPCEKAWGALLKAFSNARPARSDDAIRVLNQMLTHDKCPAPNSHHYHTVVAACLAEDPPKVASAAWLLTTAPDWIKWPSDSKTFDMVMRAVSAATQKGDIITPFDAVNKPRCSAPRFVCAAKNCSC